jgi:hypothetical protein
LVCFLEGDQAAAGELEQGEVVLVFVDQRTRIAREAAA